MWLLLVCKFMFLVFELASTGYFLNKYFRYDGEVWDLIAGIGSIIVVIKFYT